MTADTDLIHFLDRDTKARESLPENLRIALEEYESKLENQTVANGSRELSKGAVSKIIRSIPNARKAINELKKLRDG